MIYSLAKLKNLHPRAVDLAPWVNINTKLVTSYLCRLFNARSAPREHCCARLDKKRTSYKLRNNIFSIQYQLKALASNILKRNTKVGRFTWEASALNGARYINVRECVSLLKQYIMVSVNISPQNNHIYESVNLVHTFISLPSICITLQILTETFIWQVDPTVETKWWTCTWCFATNGHQKTTYYQFDRS